MTAESLLMPPRRPAVSPAPQMVLSWLAPWVLLAVAWPAQALSPQDVRQQAPGTWVQAPNSKLLESPVAAPNALSAGDYDKIRAVDGLAGIFAWSGGAFDTANNRLLIWGGGHNDYYGNEIYAFDVRSMRWQRSSEPSLGVVPDGRDANPDGTPNGRHSYSGLAYIAHAGRLFALGGALNSTSGGCGSRVTWTFSTATKKWMNQKATGAVPPTYCGDAATYDPVGRKLWWMESNSQGGGLYAYDYDTNAWTRHDDSDWMNEASGAVDTDRGLLFFHAGKKYEPAKLFVYDIGHAKYKPQKWKTTGGDAFLKKQSPGLDYDPVTKTIVGWAGGAVYALDPNTKVWTAHDAAGAPRVHGSSNNSFKTPGTYGRWRYVPCLNAFVVVTSAGDNVYFFKLSAGGGFSCGPGDP